MFVHAEEGDASVLLAEGLHPVEHGLAVVKARGRRVERKRAVGNDFRFAPAARREVFEDEHVVREILAEAELRFGRTLARVVVRRTSMAVGVMLYPPWGMEMKLGTRKVGGSASLTVYRRRVGRAETQAPRPVRPRALPGERGG